MTDTCFDIPFIPDEDYPDFLADKQEHLASVHFSLSHPAIANARQRLHPSPIASLISGLNKLGNTPRYLLINARLHAPEKYFDTTSLAITANILARLTDEANLTGVIFADPYHLQALSDAHPDITSRLEAVPSINTILDSTPRAFAMLGMINVTEFKPPSRIILDRSLNRDRPLLAETVTQLKATHPNLDIALLANEGCLYQCPYKSAHDAHIALVNEGLCGERTFAMNRDYGCVRRLLTDPPAFLTSPFIRPEDLTSYSHIINTIKLCGRNRGVLFLKRVVNAYIAGRYAGNLLDLMDAMGDLADKIDIPNALFPSDFISRISTCDKLCHQCDWCSSLAARIIRRTDPGLPTL